MHTYKRAVSRWFFLAEDGKWRDCNTGAALVLKKGEPLPAFFEMKRDGKRALCVTRMRRSVSLGNRHILTEEPMTDTYTIDVEYTDTFAGQANYSWVRRAEIEIPCGSSRKLIMRRAKAAVGLTGARGRSYSHGDMWEFRPSHCCTVMFAHVRY